MGIKQVKDGCWTFGDGDRVCYPYPVAGGRYVDLELELEKLGFKLSDEENNWYFGDDLDETGVFTQEITFNQTSFNNFNNTVNNSVNLFMNMLGIVRTQTESYTGGNFFWVTSTGVGLRLFEYAVDLFWMPFDNNLVLSITMDVTDTANP